MSLKAIHVCFIILAAALAIYFGFWSLHEYAASGNFVSLAMATGSFIGAGALLVYLLWFLSKMKRVGQS